MSVWMPAGRMGAREASPSRQVAGEGRCSGGGEHKSTTVAGGIY